MSDLDTQNIINEDTEQKLKDDGCREVKQFHSLKWSFFRRDGGKRVLLCSTERIKILLLKREGERKRKGVWMKCDVPAG